MTKKSSVVVGTKEIPTNVLESGDKIVLGNDVPVRGNGKCIGLNGGITLMGTAGADTFFGSPCNVSMGAAITDAGVGNRTAVGVITDPTRSGMVADSSYSNGATLTFNGNNSFTLAVTDSTLSVYVY